MSKFNFQSKEDKMRQVLNKILDNDIGPQDLKDPDIMQCAEELIKIGEKANKMVYGGVNE